MSQIHWNYYLSIEDALENLSRYIEFNKDNFDTYSQENAKILMTAAQESDVLFKAICNYHKNTSKSISGYFDFFKTNYPKIFATKISIPRYLLEFYPFAGWDSASAPPWWTANNKVKHHRGTNFHRASLVNSINSVAALLTLNIYFHALSCGGFFDPEVEPTLLKTEKDMYATRGHLLKHCFRIP